ncbi:unnamed protein product [Trichobilharzia szidati]|nr:unnamed protein product [Trichobilharzia szidati]
MCMELLVEMQSNLSAAHFNERRAKQCLKIGNVEGAIHYYKKAIAFMELTREEVEEEDHDYVVIDLQLSALKLNLSEVISKKTAVISSEQNETLKAISNLKSSNGRKSLDSEPLPLNEASSEKERSSAIKLPKTEFQTREELVTCIEELRKLVDMLTSQLSRVREMLTQEREHRLAIEAELISSGAYACQSSRCFSYDEYDNDDGFDENRPCIFTDLPAHKCFDEKTNVVQSAETDFPTVNSNMHCSPQELYTSKTDSLKTN